MPFDGKNLTIHTIFIFSRIKFRLIARPQHPDPAKSAGAAEKNGR
jgi:hypothetical protein